MLFYVTADGAFKMATISTIITATSVKTVA